ncbi:multicopper oxidase domain-containing protein [Pendulispora brunnea]|uniref:Multicopper oxidase domain-containing protein n=1 Tax=Pendulispora brunnea TaxID=2905690 RepID=A0ABZ2KCK5_9BACT
MRTRHLAHLCVPVVIVAAWTGCGPAPEDADQQPIGKVEQASGPPSTNQQLLDPTTIPQFVDQLPIPRTFAPTLIRDGSGRVVRQEFTVSVAPSKAQMLPPGFPDTTVMAFGGQVKIPGSTSTEFIRSVPGSVFENTRGIPTTLHWLNQITTNHFLPIDPTLHWANPNFIEPPSPPFSPFPPGYSKALSNVGMVTHNHGLVVLSGHDGIAEEWFTNSGVTGPIYVTRDYDMPNQQPGTQLFYHDHTMGMTRIGLYAGQLGAAYFIRDPNSRLDQSTSPLPRDGFEIPLVLSDRAFFTDGELNFPRESANVSNAYWQPGEDSDVIVVNGKTWPNLNVQRRHYRFRTLGASNSRIFTVQLDNNGTIVPFTIIGSDGGYLPAPQVVNEVTLGITERADILVDFSRFARGTKILMRNTNVDPDVENPETVGKIMQFTVQDSPAVSPPALPASLFPPRPALSANAPRRIKTFHNILAQNGDQLRSVDGGIDFTAPTTEFPLVGSTEEWTLVNIPGGASHQIHIHLIEFQVVNRQTFDSDAYLQRWLLLNGHRPVTRPITLDPNPYLTGTPTTLPYETGWKDTVRVAPGEVVKVLARWAPQETPAGGVQPGENQFPIDPTTPPGYLWHCHIVAHEDHDMMRMMPLVNSWGPGIAYKRGTVVAYQNVDYRARVDHTSISNQPPRGTLSVWERVNNNDGTWQPQIIYAVGDRALYNGQLYVAKQIHQAQSDWQPSTTPSLWDPYPMTACAQLAILCRGEADPAASKCHDDGAAGDENVCGGEFQDCLAACTDNGGLPHEAAPPCSGLCTANAFKVPDGATFNSGALGTNSSCFETRSEIRTGTCQGFAAGRELTVNGVRMACDGSNWRLPRQRNGGYCIQTNAGNNSSASFSVRH